MATNVTPSRHSGDTREFVLAMLVAFVVMVAVIVGTLYLLGYVGHGARDADYDTAPRVFTAEDLTPPAKPTAVWKFRADWQKPAHP